MSSWQILAVLGLGALHGVNPAMGWLLSVYSGLQQGSQRALLRTLGPIGAGHALSVALVLVLLELGRHAVAGTPLRLVCGGLLVAFALRKLLRARRHPRWVGLRLRPHELAGWSFLMSSAHGAGLMLLPVLATGGDGPLGAGALTALAATALHTVAMLVVLAAVALLVYRWLGVGLLRRAWVDIDRIWAGALLAAGAATLVLG